jgi:hypothetical protein
MVTKFRKPLLALALAMYLISWTASPAVAGMIASSASTSGMSSDLRGEEISKIQRALENEILTEKFRAYGLSPQEIKDRLQSMSDEQIHLMAQASDQLLLAGDDGLGIVIAILVIILLVILIMKLMDKKVVIK